MLKNAFTKLAVIAAVGALSQAAMAADGTVMFTLSGATEQMLLSLIHI